MKEFRNRIYYKIELTADSSLTIGSGNDVFTDHDVIVDNSGSPFIPATGIDGALRAYISNAFGDDSAIDIFGKIAKNKTEINVETKLRVYDALCDSPDDQVYITTRDCVKLQNKVAVKGAKFDLQTVEKGTRFTSYIELLNDDCADKIENALSAIDLGMIRFGAKTTRGFGKMRLTAYKRCISNVFEWLEFKMYDDSSWVGVDSVDLDPGLCSRITFNIELGLKDGLSIREYSTEVNMPDYKTLSMKSSKKKTIPIIPGTTWVGAIKERCSEILNETDSSNRDLMDQLFGFVNDKTSECKKSEIWFDESTVDDGVDKEVTRNSIDRFSGGTKNGALYTELSYFGGNTELTITLPLPVDDKVIFAIGVCLADLHFGFLAVGGLTSVGRGLFEVKSVHVNGNDLTEFIAVDEPQLKGFVSAVSKSIRRDADDE